MSDPSIIPNMPPDQYRAAVGMNQSLLKTALEDTEELRYAITNGHEEKEEMQQGTAFHTALIEPARFAGYYRRWEKVKGKADAAFAEDLAAARAGGLELYRSDWGIDEMVEAVKRHPQGSPILETPGGLAEPSLFWTRDEVPCKARLDGVWIDAGVVVDVKTIKNVRTKTITDDATYRGYFFQAAWCIDGLRRITGRKDWRWFNVWVKNDGNPTVRVTEVGQVGLEWGALKVDEAWRAWRRCCHSGDWTAYPDVDELIPPSWCLRELDNRMEVAS